MDTLRPTIHQILSAPGTDLSTISAKRVRKQLLEVDPKLTSEFVKENKDAIDALIESVFDEVSKEAGFQPESQPAAGSGLVKRKRQEDEDGTGGDASRDEEEDEDDEESSPPPTKPKKKRSSREMTDEELARQLSNEINSRSRAPRASSSGKSKKAKVKAASRSPKKIKSPAKVVSDGEDDDGSDSSETWQKKKKKQKVSSGGGGAKGGFAKEFLLSEPLAAVLDVEKLSRPQVVKQLWVYIKGNDLQNPSNKREILCDERLRAVFNVDKIDMFKMNKVLGQHLHEDES